MLEMFIMYILLKWHPSPFYIKDIWWINVALLAILSMFYPHCSIYSNDSHVGQLAGTSNIILKKMPQGLFTITLLQLGKD
jgi:hypothetical protein